MPSRFPRIAALTLGAATLLAGLVMTVSPPQAAAATQICDKYGSTKIQGGRYVVQNNEWGANDGQCISVTDSGFSVVSGNHNVPTNGAPASYPSIFAGCHYANCSTGSGLPLQVSSFGNVSSSVSYTTTNGYWDAAYDLWFDPNPNQTGQNTGAEIMIWGAHQGPPQPVGSRVGTVNLAGATWDVWFGNIGWNVISYVRQQTTTSLNISVTAFTNDAVSRGYVQRSWYLTSVQFGFEPWQGGPGLAVNSFSFSTSGAPPAGGSPACQAQHRITNTWNGGFTGEATITNTGGAEVQNWRSTWTVPSGVTVTSGWNATVSQSGTTVTAAAPTWSQNLAAGQSTTIGYQATGPSSAPSGFALNGTACS
jgi:hypothetical protein